MLRCLWWMADMGGIVRGEASVLALDGPAIVEEVDAVETAEWPM